MDKCLFFCSNSAISDPFFSPNISGVLILAAFMEEAELMLPEKMVPHENGPSFTQATSVQQRLSGKT